MKDLLETLSVHPLLVLFALAVAGLAVIYVTYRLVQRSISARLAEGETGYHARKLIALLAWVVAIVFLVALFGTRLRSLALTVGLAGAGLALGLKEVIFSLSGWAAITMGNFYKTGDRIELGGSRAM
jgi:small-conductance mechanosensitive channel